MTTNSFFGPRTPKKEEEEEEDEEEDRFYESFDRILSSSCSSTSNSDDDNPRLPHPSPYDVWLSVPSSVEERRRVLLKKLDLVGDPALALARSQPPPSVEIRDEVPDLLESAGSDVVLAKPEDSDIVFAKSENSDVVYVKSADSDVVFAKSADSDVVFVKSASSGTSDTVYEEDEEQSYTIRNLDNGEEFVVKEASVNGNCEKLKLVVTGGRQLTIQEFQNCVIGQSPIVQELLRRQNEESGSGSSGKKDKVGDGGVRPKKKGGWFRSIKNAAGAVVHRKERRSSDERDTSSENGRRRSSSATDDSQDVHSHHGSERVRVRHYGKAFKELTGLYMNQEIQAHAGSIWTIKFSLDGQYLASAGEDCVIHIWQVESGRKAELLGPVEDASAHSNSSVPVPSDLDRTDSEKRRKGKVHGARKSFSFDHVVIPENVFALSEKPVFSLHGHGKDVLDLSWSKSKCLLSSSMDKTVRLWDLTSNSCLKTFSHNDYVTCIQFNPVNDNYFISGSLDAKVRIWSVECRQVVGWEELHEMVTAACYTPDGQGAYVGSHKGNCHFFSTSENKLQKKIQVSIQNKKKKSHLKKITGFEFVPGSSSEVFITSADSRIRVVDDRELVHKFKGFRNKTSQISASLTADGKHVICASEDSQVYVWRYEADSRTSRSIGSVTVTQNYEHFHCRDVSAAVAWPGTTSFEMSRSNSNSQNVEDVPPQSSSHILADAADWQQETHLPAYECNDSPHHSSVSPANSNHFSDRGSATWPEEKLSATQHKRTHGIGEFNLQVHSTSAWGMVIVTAGRGGEIKTFQNFGYPIRV